MDISESLFSRACKVIPGGVNSPVRAFRSVGGTPFFTTRAEGPFLYTADDRELIDFVCTWGPAIWGHNAPVVTTALLEAAGKGTSFGTPNPKEVEMAECLVDGVLSLEMVRMCNSGTEATLSAVRLARGFTGRNKLVKFSGCYHGHVDSLLVAAGSGALTLGVPDSAGIPPALAQETLIVPFNDRERLRKVFKQWGREIAAVIVEPYPANCGLILPGDGFLQFLRTLTLEYDALLIFDEVMTGFRLGFSGVQGLTGVVPDLTALGKIIGGGLPVGAFGGRESIMKHLAPLGPVYQAGTLSGNPLAMAAGLASLNALKGNSPYEALGEAGTYMRSELLKAAQKRNLPLQLPQAGSMFAFFFSTHRVDSLEMAQASDTETFKKFFHLALDRGVYLPPSPFETCFISAAHSPEVLEAAVSRLCDALNAL